MNQDRARHEQQPAFVLHTYPFRDTSVIVEAFTRHHGRVGLIARGARSARSPLRSALLAFQPLAVAWAGRGELRTLARAEGTGPAPSLGGRAMMCGYYLNELILKLLQRDDPHEALFDAYARALMALGGPGEAALTLRRFEIALLREIGYGLLLDRDASSGRPLEPEAMYAYLSDLGPVPADELGGRTAPATVRGKTLLDIAADDFSDPLTAAESKALMRSLIGHHLDHRVLHTRQMLIELQQI